MAWRTLIRWRFGALGFVGLAIAVAWAGGDRSATADDGPKVRSKAAAEAAGGRLDTDYPGAPVDWSRVPSWDQAEFFGVREKGQFFVFVVDCSGSMADGRLQRAKAELRRCIARLQHPQRFLVIFYNDQPIVMPGGIPAAAGPAEFDRLDRWLRWIVAEGPTDPREATRQALGYRPSAVYLVSDGEFPRGSAEAIAASNRSRIPIHCIGLGSPEGLEEASNKLPRSPAAGWFVGD